MSVRSARWPAGTPCWLDLGTPAPDTSSAFYSSLLGWEARQGPPEAAGYRMALLRDSVVAGIRPDRGPAGWVTYLASDDVGATLRRVVLAGGRAVSGPVSLLSEGAMAVAQDPTGAQFGIWEPEHLIGAELVNEPGGFCWSELLTPDPQRSRDFHAGVFGHAFNDHGGEDFSYDLIRLGTTAVAGMAAIGPGPAGALPMGPQWLAYFSVDDTDEMARRATALGGRVQIAPTESPHGRMALLRGRLGELFGVLEADDLPRPT